MRTHEDGAVVVEFGIVFPLLALMLAGAVTFGLAYSAQLSLQQAAREGVRAYALGSGDPVATARGAATHLTMTVTTSGDCDPNAPGSPPPQAWVSTATTFDVPVPFVPLRSIDLSARAVMRCGG
jgi:hypothetical protein